MKAYRIHVLTLSLLLVAFVSHAATIYGIRYKANPDGTQQRIRWLTSATSAEFEVPGHGTVLVHVEGEELWLEANGDAAGGRSLTIKGVVVNQLRCGFEK